MSSACNLIGSMQSPASNRHRIANMELDHKGQMFMAFFFGELWYDAKIVRAIFARD